MTVNGAVGDLRGRGQFIVLCQAPDSCVRAGNHTAFCLSEQSECLWGCGRGQEMKKGRSLRAFVS